MHNIGVLLVVSGLLLAALALSTFLVFVALVRSSQLTQAYEVMSGASVEQPLERDTKSVI